MNYASQDLATDETGSPDTDNISRLVEEANVAERLSEEQLNQIGEDCSRGYETDFQTLSDWLEQVNEWMSMATQVMEQKNFPWPGASNVKYPLVSVAAMQFSARAYPTLIPSDGKIVKPVVVGKDPSGEKLKRAIRATSYMNWQLVHEMENWEEDMDRLLIMDAIMGCVFKKTYYDPYNEQVCSRLVDPRHVVINYDAESLEKAERISEDVFLYEREVEERKRMGLFLDVDIGKPSASSFDNRESTADDDTIPYFLIEQHTWLDLDDDGIKEPWVVTFHKETKKVLRITARFTPKDIQLNEKGKIKRVKPLNYYTKFGFIPNPESRIYDLGFGHLLGPINESVNTIINQLVDSGTLANLQSGFIGKGLRIKMGDQPIRPGEWKAVNATGDDLKKQIVPLPVKEPSSTLFNLLGTLITSGKELASVAEIFVGKMPGQNTPATTTMATIEQGMKVFTAIYKRVYRSLFKEFKKIYRLNGIFLDPQTMVLVLDEPVGNDDFSMDGYDICPGADPTAVSSTERLLKAQGLLELLPLGTIDPIEVTKRVLEAQDQPNWEELIPGMKESGQAQIPERPDPKMLEMQMKMQADQMLADLKQRELANKMAMDQRSAEFDLTMKKALGQMKLAMEAQKAELDAAKADHMQKIFMRDSAQKAQVRDIEAGQKLAHNEISNKQKLRHQEETARSKSRATSSKSGPRTSSPKRS